jgi:hypothetical protein
MFEMYILANSKPKYFMFFFNLLVCVCVGFEFLKLLESVCFFFFVENKFIEIFIMVLWMFSSEKK